MLKTLLLILNGQRFSGSKVNGLRNRHAKLRGKLQAKATRSAKCLFEKRGRREHRFAAAVNRSLSKRVVVKVKGAFRGVVLEGLKGIRERVAVRGSI